MLSFAAETKLLDSLQESDLKLGWNAIFAYETLAAFRNMEETKGQRKHRTGKMGNFEGFEPRLNEAEGEMAADLRNGTTN